MMSQYDQEEILTYDVEEGNFTVVENSLVIPNGAEVVTGTFAAQVNAENFLEPGAGENSMKGAITLATHFNLYKPEVSGQLPEVSTLAAACPRRYVGAALLKRGERLLPLIDTNQQIAVGDALEVAVGFQGLDKAAGATNLAYAQETAAANAGGYIRVRVEGPIAVQS